VSRRSEGALRRQRSLHFAESPVSATIKEPAEEAIPSKKQKWHDSEKTKDFTDAKPREGRNHEPTKKERRSRCQDQEVCQPARFYPHHSGIKLNASRITIVARSISRYASLRRFGIERE